MTALVEFRAVSRSFGGVHALENVNLSLGSGEVLGLLGHNGAGKSTLMKLLSGALVPDAGQILIDGEAQRIRSPDEAHRLGVGTIYQTLALAENLDAAANLFLGRERLTRAGLLDHEAMLRETREVLTGLNPHFTDLRAPVRQLSGGQRQSIAIARAIKFEARVLIMDEPTAALGPAETAAVGRLIRHLKSTGLGIFLVSHDIHDVFDLSDRIAVLKGGRLVGVAQAAAISKDEALAMIIAGTCPPGAVPGPGALGPVTNQTA